MKKLWADLDKLGVFVAVAEKGKINDAAEVLNLTQPSVSRSIQKLEDSFGAPLFVRGRGGVKLTGAGHLLYQRASRMLRELDDLKVRARFADDELSGVVTVGTYESLAEYLWPDFIVKVSKLHPRLNLSVKTSPQHDPLADLVAGRIDLMVDAEPQSKGEVTSWPLYSDRFGLFTARQGGAENALILIQGAWDQDRMSIEDHLAKAGVRFERELFFDSFSTVKRLAVRGMGVAVLPLRLAEEDLKNKLLKRVNYDGLNPDGFGKHTIYATTSSEKEKDVRIKKLVALLRGHFKT